MSFYLTVLMIAIIILILALTSVGLLISRLNASKKFPPSAANCPDYWVINTDGSCAIPVSTNAPIPGYTTANTPGISSSRDNINFTDARWKDQGLSEICAKKKWANTYNVIWNGVSNNNTCNA